MATPSSGWLRLLAVRLSDLQDFIDTRSLTPKFLPLTAIIFPADVQHFLKINLLLLFHLVFQHNSGLVNGFPKSS